MKHLFFLIMIVFYSSSALAEDLILDLVKVSDGDTIKVLLDGEKQAVRLLDIDCYETEKRPRAIKQSEYYHLSVGKVIEKGLYSKQVLKDLLKKEKKVRVKWDKKDRYRRLLGEVYRLDGLNINEYMLKDGLCQPYIQF